MCQGKHNLEVTMCFLDCLNSLLSDAVHIYFGCKPLSLYLFAYLSHVNFIVSLY